MDKEDFHNVHTHTCIYNGVVHGHKQKCNNDMCSCMDDPRDYHTK